MYIIQTVEFINSLFEEPLQSKGIELSVQYHLKNGFLITDKGRFEQIYFQLLQNSVKFTLSGQIRFNIYNNADRFILSIEDTGMGLSEKDEHNLNYLLDQDEFIKVSDSQIGSGMGLVISNMIVKQLNRGVPIKFKRLLKGTQFYFELPNDIQEIYIFQLKGFNRKFLRFIKCDHAFNGQDSIALIKNKKENPCQHCHNQYYLLIFLEINMPIIDGFQTIKIIKAQMKTEEIKKVYCIALPGLSDLQTKQKCYENGMDYFMNKPINQNLLKEILLIFFPTLEIKVI